MKTKKLISSLGKRFPLSAALDFDFPGYQTGIYDKDREVKKVFLCLDFTEACFKTCLEYSPDLILTHHPFIFGKKKDVFCTDLKKAQLDYDINDLLKCPLYSYHTNFDIKENGMNDSLLEILNWKVDHIARDHLMRIVSFDKEKDMDEILNHLLDTFSFEYLGYLKFHEKIKSLGFIAGGAGNDFMDAVDEKVDLYISGDCAHHARVDMTRYQLNYIELPHEVEEYGFLYGMKKALLKINPSLDILPYSYEKYFSLKVHHE